MRLSFLFIAFTLVVFITILDVPPTNANPLSLAEAESLPFRGLARLLQAVIRLAQKVIPKIIQKIKAITQSVKNIKPSKIAKVITEELAMDTAGNAISSSVGKRT